jgi:hypothetical protein
MVFARIRHGPRATPSTRPPKKTLQTLDRDIETLEGEAKFIFSLSAGAEGLTQQSVAMLLRWHIAERAPSLSALAIFVAKYLGTNMPPEIARAVLAASVLGEVENNLPYHNNLHYKKVLFQTARLIAMHNNIYEGTDQTFNCKKIGMLMIAACIHDLGHDGRGNTIKGVFEPGRLERRAFKLAFPYLEACGLDYADLEKTARYASVHRCRAARRSGQSGEPDEIGLPLSLPRPEEKDRAA